MQQKSRPSGRLFSFDALTFHLGEPKQLQNAERLAVVFVGEIEVEPELLCNRDLEGFDELDEGAVGVFNIGEMAVGIAHTEVGATVAHERMPHGFGLRLDGIHVTNIEAEVDETRVAPIAVFVKFLARSVNALDELKMRGPHDAA